MWASINGARIRAFSSATVAKRSTCRSGTTATVASTWAPLMVPACHAARYSGHAARRWARLAIWRAAPVPSRQRWRSKAASEP